MHSVMYVLDIFLGFLEFMMSVYALISLLIFFRVLNPYGRIVGMVWQNMVGLFEPLMQPIRRLLPPYRGFDWSFLVLYLLIVLTRSLLREYSFVGPVGM